jgi:hypothetical protein
MSAQFVLHAAPAGVAFAPQPYGASPYQRVFTLLSPEQLQLVLVKGWEALDSSPVFCSDAGTCAGGALSFPRTLLRRCRSL